MFLFLIKILGDESLIENFVLMIKDEVIFLILWFLWLMCFSVFV